MNDIDIILVDDEESLLEDINEFFSDYNLKTFSNPDKALLYLQNHPCDIIISDYKMPQMTGIDLLVRAKQNNLYSEAILFTAYADKKLLEEIINKNLIFKIVEKPVILDKLKATIDSVIIKINSKRLEIQNVESIKGKCKKLLQSIYISGHNIIGLDKGLKDVFQKVEMLSSLKENILLTGETGTGKEVIARLIHLISDRRDSSFITVNCASIPDDLLESELFGYTKGAFTGATKNKPGKIELAHGGTLFLDEIGDMKHNLQAKILRVLQEKKVERLGACKEIDVDFRLISATNKKLDIAIKNKELRSDLFYRISTFSIQLPKLCERKEDIEDLIKYYLNQFCEKNQIKKPKLNNKVLNFLINYSWPGNIRQLINAIKQATIQCGSNKEFSIEDFSSLNHYSENQTEEFESMINIFRNGIIEKKYKLKDIENSILHSLLIYYNLNVKETVEKTKIPKDRFYKIKKDISS